MRDALPRRDGRRGLTALEPPAATSVLVLVCGSLDRGDDAAALLAVRGLPALDPRVVVREVGQLDVEDLLDLPPDGALLVLDAVRGPEPGSILRLPLADLPTARPQPGSTHVIPPDEAVALASLLRGSPLPGLFLGLAGRDFGMGSGLSPEVEAALPAYRAAIVTAVEELLAG